MNAVQATLDWPCGLVARLHVGAQVPRRRLLPVLYCYFLIAQRAMYDTLFTVLHYLLSGLGLVACKVHISWRLLNNKASGNFEDWVFCFCMSCQTTCGFAAHEISHEAWLLLRVRVGHWNLHSPANVYSLIGVNAHFYVLQVVIYGHCMLFGASGTAQEWQ